MQNVFDKKTGRGTDAKTGKQKEKDGTLGHPQPVTWWRARDPIEPVSIT